MLWLVGRLLANFAAQAGNFSAGNIPSPASGSLAVHEIQCYTTQIVEAPLVCSTDSV